MKKKDFETSSGNVFADLGLPNPEERLAKSDLAMQISLLIEEKGMSQTEAAELLGTDQAKISALSKGKLAGFSLERLIRFLNILGKDVDIKVTSKVRGKSAPSLRVILQQPRRSHVNPESRRAMLARKK